MKDYVVDKRYINNKAIYILKDIHRAIIYEPYTMDRIFTTPNHIDDAIVKLKKDFNYKLSKDDFNISTIKVIISTQCNFRCDYCTLYKNHKQVPCENMNKDEADKIIDYYNKHIKNGVVLFTGGEPLINWETIRYFLNSMDAKFILQTNGSLMNDQIVKTLKEKNVLVLLSLDGYNSKQNSSRKFINGEIAYESIINGYRKAKSANCTIGISIVADNNNVQDLFDMTQNLRKNLGADSFGFNIPHYTKYNDSDVNIQEYTEQIKKIFHFAKVEKVYIDQVARKLKPLLYKSFRMMDCSAAGEQIIFFPDGSVTNCVNYPPFNENYELKRWKTRVPFYNDLCKDCISVGLCGGGCYYDGISRYKEGVDLRNCYYTKAMTEFFLWDFYNEMQLNGFNEQELYGVYNGILGINSVAGISAGHESKNLSQENLKKMENKHNELLEVE